MQWQNAWTTDTDFLFHPGLATAVFSLVDIPARAQALLTVVEGPQHDELTLKVLHVMPLGAVDAFILSVRSDLMDQVTADLRSGGDRAEMYRNLLLSPASEFSIATDHTIGRVYLLPDAQNNQVAITIVDERTNETVVSLLGQRLREVCG